MVLATGGTCAAHGWGRDYQITKKDYDLYPEALGKHQKVTFRWYEDLSHLFMPGEGKATPQEYAKAGNVDEGVIRDLVKWIKKEG